MLSRILEKETPYTFGRIVNYSRHYGKQFGSSSKNYMIQLYTTPGYTPKRIKVSIQ
jgi:hypothetical protein